MKKDHVTRMNNKNYLRLKKITQDGTFNERIEILLDMVEKFQEGTMVYLGGDKWFSDVAEARGESIVRSVRSGLMAEKPKVAVIIGEDEM